LLLITFLPGNGSDQIVGHSDWLTKHPTVPASSAEEAAVPIAGDGSACLSAHEPVWRPPRPERTLRHGSRATGRDKPARGVSYRRTLPAVRLAGCTPWRAWLMTGRETGRPESMCYTPICACHTSPILVNTPASQNDLLSRRSAKSVTFVRSVLWHQGGGPGPVGPRRVSSLANG
jgi:hypothetical protein